MVVEKRSAQQETKNARAKRRAARTPSRRATYRPPSDQKKQAATAYHGGYGGDQRTRRGIGGAQRRCARRREAEEACTPRDHAPCGGVQGTAATNSVSRIRPPERQRRSTPTLALVGRVSSKITATRLAEGHPHVTVTTSYEAIYGITAMASTNIYTVA